MLSFVAAVLPVYVSLSRVVLVKGAVFPVKFEITVELGEGTIVPFVMFDLEVGIIGLIVVIFSACTTAIERARRQQARPAEMVSMTIKSCNGKQNMSTSRNSVKYVSRILVICLNRKPVKTTS